MFRNTVLLQLGGTGLILRMKQKVCVFERTVQTEVMIFWRVLPIFARYLAKTYILQAVLFKKCVNNEVITYYSYSSASLLLRYINNGMGLCL